MCYHTLYIFLICGHSVPSYKPLGHSPPCPTRSRTLFRKPSLASPIIPVDISSWTAATAAPQDDIASGSNSDSEPDFEVVCREKLSHPLHTYRIAGQCPRCVREREERLARFEVGSIRDGMARESFLSAVSRQRRGNETLQLKEKITSPRSGYVEGRGRGLGMILERNRKGDLVGGIGEGESSEEVKVVAEAIGWYPDMGVFKGGGMGAGRERAE
jgi:hypothetical protein